jgi:hypothetical protein
MATGTSNCPVIEEFCSTIEMELCSTGAFLTLNGRVLAEVTVRNIISKQFL